MTTLADEGAGGRVALVTGAVRGIGLATAVRLRDAGFQVVGTWHRMEPPSVEGIRWVWCDITSASSVTALAADVAEHEAQVDVVVGNAGAVRDRSLARLDEDDVREQVEVNLVAQIRLCRTFAPAMAKRRWGRIVLVSSVGAFTANAGQATYATTKLALVSLARVAARELGARGVTANVVAPGIIDTELMATFPPRWRERWVAQVPLGRMGAAEEVADAIAFLVAEEAGFLTGIVLPVDGGYLASIVPSPVAETDR